ncbi:hypothetical protein MZO42_13810 [Sphingomonas psychrotolerans]|uniref:Uncharacterized protein n=1 Tax=Sphingomonas psychrotolerans TaxID=1327635 RepID=A0ABU3N7C3_9SPHN|nr:hypothetical protein [Sphingomonas psychrotolerans]MDT8759774.1 hypothetical protein [Sphingomonas psychrotolerans]
MLLLSVVGFGVADMAAFSGRHIAGIGNVAREQIETIRVKADEYSRKPI